jgi:hypothetical protein
MSRHMKLGVYPLKKEQTLNGLSIVKSRAPFVRQDVDTKAPIWNVVLFKFLCLNIWNWGVYPLKKEKTFSGLEIVESRAPFVLQDVDTNSRIIVDVLQADWMAASAVRDQFPQTNVPL